MDRRRNRHIYTQQQQLLPVDYDVVARVDQFDEVMNDIGLGDLLPDGINATSGAVNMPEAWAMTAGELNAFYRETGHAPNKASLLNQKLVDEINGLYQVDLRAFGQFLNKGMP